MRYKIFCRQLHQYFANEATFKSLEEIKERLINFHSADCDEKTLKEQTLADIIDGFEWEIHDTKGNVVPI